MSLVYDSYSYKYGDYGLNNGTIFDINISGGTSFSSQWFGPTDRFGSIGLVSGFTNLSNTIKHPDLINLYPGIYSGYSYDNLLPSSSATTTIEILEREKLLLDASLYDDSCLIDESLFCTLRVNNFNHDVNNFVYNLYVNNGDVPIKTYSGSRGTEEYDFTGLTGSNTYKIEAYETDEIVYTYKNIVGCIDGNIEIENGTDPVNIVNNWDKISLMSENNIPIYYYVNQTLMFIKSGLNNDGTITNSDPNSWFYTGTPETSNVWFKEGSSAVNYFLGSSGKTNFVNVGIMSPNQTMVEGMNIGPKIDNLVAPFSTTTNATTSDFYELVRNYGYRFYYNTDIKKFLILLPTHGTSSGGYHCNWCTYDPRNDYSSSGNPTTSIVLTSGDQWWVSGLTNTQYTISGETNTVVRATDKLPGNNMVVGRLNTNILSGFVSGCGYSNYKHEVTIGSELSGDNDILGIILASFRDDAGIYGPTGVTHNITLSLSPSGNIYENVKEGCTIHHNFGTTAYGFTGNTDNVIIYSTNVPFSMGNTTTSWDAQGNIRLRITREDKEYGSGNGEIFKIEMTNMLKLNGLGTSKPYSSSYTLSFDISDSTTWQNKGDNTNLNHGDQPKALMKFIGPQKYGYYSISQPNAYFFDITFSGEQTSIRPTIQTLEPAAKDDEIISIIPYNLNCEYIETICSSDFSGSDTNTRLYIDILDNTNNPSVTFDLTSSVISDPCPNVIPNICGCPCDVCDRSIRINIKKKQ